MKDKVNVLGTEYTVSMVDYNSEPYFEQRGCGGYCDHVQKYICVCNLKTYSGLEHESEAYYAGEEKHAVRHEVVHAFLFESGLGANAGGIEESWATNEEMVDWIAAQGEKIHKAWVDVGCV